MLVFLVQDLDLIEGYTGIEQGKAWHEGHFWIETASGAWIMLPLNAFTFECLLYLDKTRQKDERNIYVSMRRI